MPHTKLPLLLYVCCIISSENFPRCQMKHGRATVDCLHSTQQLMACSSLPLCFLTAQFCQKFYNLKISLTHWKLLAIFFKSLEKKLPLEGICITHNIVVWFVLLSNVFIKYLGIQQCKVVLNAPNFPCSVFLLTAYYNVCFLGAYCVT